MVERFTRQLGELSDVLINVVTLHSQFVKFCGCVIGFIDISSRLDEFFLKVFIDRFVWSRRNGNGQDPVLRALFPFVDVWAIYIGEGMGYFLPWIHHNWVRRVHELIEVQFLKEMISLLSVSFKDGGFSPLEWFFVYSDWIRISWELWWRS